MTLRLVLDDGTNLVATFPGAAANLGLRAPQPAATSIVAAPGADINTLANQYGTVHLTAGTYNLSAPLVLNQPVTITADPGTTLLFAQVPGDPTWTAAIKINAGNTTLSGFAVRFAGPINWTSGDQLRAGSDRHDRQFRHRARPVAGGYHADESRPRVTSAGQRRGSRRRT